MTASLDSRLMYLRPDAPRARGMLPGPIVRAVLPIAEARGLP